MFACNLCGQSLLVGEEQIGEETACAGCRQRIEIPPKGQQPPKAPAAKVLRLPRFFTNPSTVCPFCGGKNLQTTYSGLSLGGDRACQSCEAVWTPAAPKWILITALTLSCACLGFMIFLVTHITKPSSEAHTPPYASYVGYGFILVLVCLIAWCIFTLEGKIGKLVIHKTGIWKSAGEASGTHAAKLT